MPPIRISKRSLNLFSVCCLWYTIGCSTGEQNQQPDYSEERVGEVPVEQIERADMHDVCRVLPDVAEYRINGNYLKNLTQYQFDKQIDKQSEDIRGKLIGKHITIDGVVYDVKKRFDDKYVVDLVTCYMLEFGDPGAYLTVAAVLDEEQPYLADMTPGELVRVDGTIKEIVFFSGSATIELDPQSLARVDQTKKSMLDTVKTIHRYP